MSLASELDHRASEVSETLDVSQFLKNLKILSRWGRAFSMDVRSGKFRSNMNFILLWLRRSLLGLVVLSRLFTISKKFPALVLESWWKQFMSEWNRQNTIFVELFLFLVLRLFCKSTGIVSFFDRTCVCKDSLLISSLHVSTPLEMFSSKILFNSAAPDWFTTANLVAAAFTLFRKEGMSCTAERCHVLKDIRHPGMTIQLMSP